MILSGVERDDIVHRSGNWLEAKKMSNDSIFPIVTCDLTRFLSIQDKNQANKLLS